MPSTNHGHGPLLPPCGQNGRRRRTPVYQGVRGSPTPCTLPCVPRNLPSQIPPRPVSLPETTGCKKAAEPWSFLLVQKLLYTDPSLPSTVMQTPNYTQRQDTNVALSPRGRFFKIILQSRKKRSKVNLYQYSNLETCLSSSLLSQPAREIRTVPGDC